MPKNVFRTAVVASVAVLALPLTPASPATAPTAVAAATDSFYAYDGAEPLSSYAPGDVLKTRTLTYHLTDLSQGRRATQILYRSTDAQGRPVANVTSVVHSGSGDGTRVVLLNSAYDSLDPEDGPSRGIAGTGSVFAPEELLLGQLLDRGYDVILTDTEGQDAHFAAGPEYGRLTLDSIRAATRAPQTGFGSATRFGLMGYSGGAIATHWAAVLAPGYAPDVNKKLVGFAEGGLLVDPAANLRYVGGSTSWAGIIPMALIGISRSYDVDFTPYLNSYGVETLAKLRKASPLDVLLGQYKGLTWQKLAKPEYADPASVPEFVEQVNKLNLGQAPTPTIPGYIVQGDNGPLAGTFSNIPGIGSGDGVMVSGDVRSLARQYCARGNTSIAYEQHELLAHGGTFPVWKYPALDWIDDRFDGRTPPSSCGRIPAGNSLAPVSPATR